MVLICLFLILQELLTYWSIGPSKWEHNHTTMTKIQTYLCRRSQWHMDVLECIGPLGSFLWMVPHFPSHRDTKILIILSHQYWWHVDGYDLYLMWFLIPLLVIGFRSSFSRPPKSTMHLNRQFLWHVEGPNLILHVAHLAHILHWLHQPIIITINPLETWTVYIYIGLSSSSTLTLSTPKVHFHPRQMITNITLTSLPCHLWHRYCIIYHMSTMSSSTTSSPSMSSSSGSLFHQTTKLLSTLLGLILAIKSFLLIWDSHVLVLRDFENWKHIIKTSSWCQYIRIPYYFRIIRLCSVFCHFNELII